MKPKIEKQGTTKKQDSLLIAVLTIVSLIGIAYFILVMFPADDEKIIEKEVKKIAIENEIYMLKDGMLP